MKNFKQFSEIDLFKIKNDNIDINDIKDNDGYIRLDFLLEKIINDSINKLINTSKKEFKNEIINFIDLIEFNTWFLINSLEKRKQFFQDHLSKIVGEKYRKAFSSVDIKEFKNRILNI